MRKKIHNVNIYKISISDVSQNVIHSVDFNNGKYMSVKTYAGN